MTTNLMVFIAGDNDLDSFGAKDIAEMMAVANTGDELTILVQQDQSVVARDSTTKRYVIRNGVKELTLSLGETNTGDANTLTEFLQWGMDSYEAERNIAVLWNHGGGTRDELFPGYENNETALTMRSRSMPKPTNPTLGNQPSFFPEELRLKRVEALLNEYHLQKGEPTRTISEVEARSILFDDEAKDFLDNLELKEVFVNLGKKLDIIGFDACLMGMLEVVYQLREYADVVIGSEELEPGKGWDYEAVVRFLAQNPNASNEEVARAIVEGFVASYANEESLKLTLSAIRTKKLKDVVCLLNRFAHEILRKEPNIRSTFLPIVDAAQTFDYVNNEQIYRDLKDFVKLTQAHYKSDEEIYSIAQELIEGLDDATIVSQAKNLKGANGLSVYLPLMPNMSQFAINLFSALDINAKTEAPHWLKLFKQIGNLDVEPNSFFGANQLEPCIKDEIVVVDEEILVEDEVSGVDYKERFDGLYAITALITEGRKDELAVKQLQALLNLLGESLIVDGDFGPKTTKAVKAFQETQGLVADGKVGTVSWYALYDSALQKSESLLSMADSYTTLSRDSNERELILWLESLLYLVDRKRETTAQYDERLEERVITFQVLAGCDVTGVVDSGTWNALFNALYVHIQAIDELFLRDDFIEQKALENELDPAAVKAVIKVESRGRGFRRDKQLLILFEGHIFYRELQNIGVDPEEIREGNEDIIYKKPDYRYYNRLQYPRLERAKAIDEEAALKSASYGMFQVMGFNHTLAGFDSVFEQVEYLSVSERNQLEAFINFLKNTRCYEALKAKDWAKFAYYYNGAMYKRNQYDKKLEKEYNSAKLTRGAEPMVMDEERYVSMYALELEKAFIAQKE